MDENNSNDCPTEEFKKWALGWSGCHGGDISEGSIWICGIEWGGQYNNPQELRNEFNRDVSKPPDGYCAKEGNFASQFDIAVFKIINAFNGEDIQSKYYRDLPFKPFVKGEKGFFKLNLFPLAFSSTDPALWTACYKDATGFKMKDEYKDWCRINRFVKIKKWVEDYKPKAVICFGNTETYDDFLLVFNGSNTNKLKDRGITFKNNERKLYFTELNNMYMYLIICPFPLYPNGLNSDGLRQKCGEIISEIITENE